MPSISIILVNYKRVHDTVECIDSLRKSSFHDFQIIVVDNASNDGSQEILSSTSDVKPIFQSTNLGFAGGNNVGIKHALNTGSEYILLLNNDTIVKPDMLAGMMDTMKSYPNAGIIGGKIYYYDEPNTLWFAGGRFNFNSGFGSHIGIDEIDNHQYDKLDECDYITGCMLMFRRSVVQKIGLLDERYFAYLEDVDFCRRARLSGFSVLYQPKAVIYHKISKSSAWDSPVYIYFNLRNKLLFLNFNIPFINRLPYLPKLIYYYSRQFIRLIFKYHDAKKISAAWYGLIDGIMNNTGPHGEGRLHKLVGS